MPAKDTNAAPVRVQPAPTAQPSARQPPTSISPFRTLERFADEVTRIFDDFGLGSPGGRRKSIPEDARANRLSAPRASLPV